MRFYDKYRFKRCLPFCACARHFPKVPSPHLEGNLLPVQSSSIRPVFSPQNFYESSKSCCCIPEEEGHSSPYITGRLSSFGCNSGGSCEKYSTGSESPSVPRFFKKSLLIPTKAITFLGFQIDSKCMMLSLPAEKTHKILDCCHRLLVSQSITLRNLASLIGLLESLASSTSLSSLTIRPDKGPTNEPGVLRHLDCPVTECQSRTCLVVETHPQCKRQSHTTSSAGYDHHSRRLQERLGCSASIVSDQWQMVPKSVSPTYQLSRDKGILFGLENLSQRQVSHNRISATRQHDCQCLHQQQRGHRSPQLMTLA